MSTTDSPAVERFLVRFHDTRPGRTPEAFADLPTMTASGWRSSSYEVLASAVPDSDQPISVLDLACGDGYLLSLLAARCDPALTLSGIDLSTGELAAAALRLGQRASLSQGRAQQLPYRAESFDVVLSHMALMLMDDVSGVLAEVRRTLKQGGRFAAVIGAGSAASPAMSHYLNVLSRRSRDPQWTAVRFGDVRLRSDAGIVELLSPHFEAIEVERLRQPMRLTPQEWWLRLLNMYDLYLLPESDVDGIRDEVMRAVIPECDAQGKLEFAHELRFIRAIAS